MDIERVKELDRRHHMNVYGPRFYGDILPVMGEGASIIDSTGEKYIDCVAGIACNILGYNDAEFNKAMGKVFKDGLLHLSNLFYNEVQAEYAQLLCGLLPMKNPKVFFCNSGAEAVNGAIKCAAKNKGKYIVSMNNSFHGRYGAALAVTGQKKYQKGFKKTLPRNVRFIDLNDRKGLEQITEEVYAVIVESIQGEGGIIEAKKDYMRKLRKACNDAGALLIADEVQTGFGRTGKLFAIENYRHLGVKADIICMAKGIANGIPFGAFAVSEDADLLGAGEHASTFGGNYIACAAGLVVLKQIYERELMKNAESLGDMFHDWYNHIVKPNPNVVAARGKGLMLGLEMETAEKRKKVIDGCLEDGVIVAPSGEKTIRLVPPLVISHDLFERSLDILHSNIDELKE